MSTWQNTLFESIWPQTDMSSGRAQAVARNGHLAPPASAPMNLPRLAIPAVLASIAALVLVSFAMLYSKPEPPLPRLQLKGSQDSPIRPLLDLEIFEIQSLGNGSYKPRRISPNGKIQLNAFMQLRYVCNDKSIQYVYLAGWDQRHKVLDYFPRPSENHSISIQETLRPRSIGQSIWLGKRHRTGTLWIFAFFSSEKLSRKSIRRYFESLRMHGLNEEAHPPPYPHHRNVHILMRKVNIVDAGSGQ